jgi:tetratricopeptide (TPR) repeat protein
MADEAERAYLELAERARARHAYTEAERLYSRALEQPVAAEAEARAAAYRGRGMMRYRIGRYHDALADFLCARAMVTGAAAQAEILLDEATALDWMDDYKTSEERVHEARALLAGGSTPLFDARLLLGLGRSAHRFSCNEEAVSLLQRAAEAAEPLGEEGYETLVIALLLLGFILPGEGRLEATRLALDRCIALCEAHGDRLHLGAALNTRALCWGCHGDKARLIADMERSLAVSRELGQRTLEFLAEFNLGEFLLLMDDAHAAEPHIARAIELDRKLSGDPVRPLTDLLEARLCLHRGNDRAARAIAGRLRKRQEAGALLVPAEEILCRMVELMTGAASPSDWEELEERSEHYSFGQERIEVIEARACACARLGDVAEARRHLARALGAAERIPNAMGARLRRRRTELGEL